MVKKIKFEKKKKKNFILFFNLKAVLVENENQKVGAIL
jgi:hypothetical protein